MKLDSEDQRALFIKWLDQVPLSLTNEQGQPIVPTAGVMRNPKLPDDLQSLYDAVESAEIEQKPAKG